MALAAVEEAAYFRANVEDTKNAVEEADLADVEEVDLVVNMEEEKTIGKVDKCFEWCNAMTYHS